MGSRGFQRLSANERQAIAAKGGRAAHAKRAAHQWTREEASAAGRKGGLLGHRPALRRCLDCGSTRIATERLPREKPAPLARIISTLSCAGVRTVQWNPLTEWAIDAATEQPMFWCSSEAD